MKNIHAIDNQFRPYEHIPFLTRADLELGWHDRMGQLTDAWIEDGLPYAVWEGRLRANMNPQNFVIFLHEMQNLDRTNRTVIDRVHGGTPQNWYLWFGHTEHPI